MNNEMFHIVEVRSSGRIIGYLGPDNREHGGGQWVANPEAANTYSRDEALRLAGDWNAWAASKGLTSRFGTVPSGETYEPPDWPEIAGHASNDDDAQF